MNKRIVLFVALFALCSSSMTSISMENPDEESCSSPGAAPDLKEASEGQQKKTKHKKQSGATQSAASSAAAPAPAPLKLAAPTAGIAQDDDASPKAAAAVQEIEEVLLDGSSLQRKTENYLYGTDTYVLDTLRKLGPTSVIAPSIENQKVILSAVQNLTKKGKIDTIEEFLKFAATKKGDRPVITVDITATTELKKFLLTRYQETIQPLIKIAGILQVLDLVQNTESSQQTNLSKLTQANAQALDNIRNLMLDHKQKHDNKDHKHPAK